MIETATMNQVAPEYIECAEILSNQVSGNIKARETLQILLDYPEREYPELDNVDPKKKKDVKKAPPKKKKKKEAPFPIPEWATELDAVVAKVKSMGMLASDKDNLQLDDDFLVKVQE